MPDFEWSKFEIDQVTVKELYEALYRLWPNASNYKTGTGFFNALMTSIQQYQEPDYKPETVVRDAKGVVWERTVGTTWYRVGENGSHGHSKPARPLEVIWEPPVGPTLRELRALERARDNGMPD